MSSYRVCATCHAWVWFGDTHICPPAWIVAPEADPQDMRTIYARDSEEAAEKWAEGYDSDGDYHLAKGNEMMIVVGRPGVEMMLVNVSGETVPTYRAREIGPALSPNGEAVSAGKLEGERAREPSAEVKP